MPRAWSSSCRPLLCCNRCYGSHFNCTSSHMITLGDVVIKVAVNMRDITTIAFFTQSMYCNLLKFLKQACCKKRPNHSPWEVEYWYFKFKKINLETMTVPLSMQSLQRFLFRRTTTFQNSQRLEYLKLSAWLPGRKIRLFRAPLKTTITFPAKNWALS
jgi:hypothetical protein